MNKKIALITGASRGIGKEIAFSFAQMGYDLFLIARNEIKLLEVSDIIKEQYNVHVHPIVEDIRNAGQISTQLEYLMKEHGFIEVLVNCAGIFLEDDKNSSSNHLLTMMETNLLAAQNISNCIIPGMIKNKRGYIFNISSICGVQPYKGISNYSASKYALVGYSLCLAKQLKEHNIKVTVICPDVVDTEMSANTTMANDDKIKTNDIAKAIEFLLSLSGSAYVKELVISR